MKSQKLRVLNIFVKVVANPLSIQLNLLSGLSYAIKIF